MLGSDLVLYLKDYFELYGLDLSDSKNPIAQALRGFQKCDITDLDGIMKVIKDIKPDIVVHTAAWTDVDGCELDKERAIKINSTGTHNVVLACKESGAVMFYVSTDFIFDGKKSEPYTEDDKTGPINIYGETKLMGEEFVRKELHRYFILRTSWLFGKYGRNFVDTILNKADAGGELRIVFDQFGSPTFTKDLARAIKRFIELAIKNSGLGGVYHFCNYGNCSWFKYAEQILKTANRRKTRIIPITSLELDRPAERPSMSVLDTEKYFELTGDNPRDWKVALEDYLFNEKKIKRDYVQGSQR